MAISVNPSTYVIYVPKADLTPLGGVVYELDVDVFRLWLKAWEDDQAHGITFPKTHDHNTEVSLSGITYARIVEILYPYTVEFEDGQYIVSCTGANHNIADVKVANQVSLLINNAAGLISNPAIEYSSFNGGVSLDVINGVAGTIGSTGNPIGTPRNPSNNKADTLQIANNRGFTTVYIAGNITLDTGTDFQELIFIGESKTKSVITISSDADVENCEFYEAKITGTLDGGNVLKDCLLGTINYVNGYIEQCVLTEETITLGGGSDAHFLDCWMGVVGEDIVPTIDLGGSGQSLGMRNYNGCLKIKNKTGSDKASIDLNSGEIILDSTVTAGEVIVRGVGQLVDTSGNHIKTGTWNGVTITNDLVDGVVLSYLEKIIKNKKELVKNGSVWELIIYDNDNVTPILNKAMKDKDGNDITDLAAGTLAAEIANSV